MTPTLAQILQNLQADVAALATYVAAQSPTPPSNTVAAALTQLQNDLSAVTTAANASPFNQATLLSAVATAQADLVTLANAILAAPTSAGQMYADPSVNPATGQPYPPNPRSVNTTTGN